MHVHVVMLSDYKNASLLFFLYILLCTTPNIVSSHDGKKASEGMDFELVTRGHDFSIILYCGYGRSNPANNVMLQQRFHNIHLVKVWKTFANYIASTVSRKFTRALPQR